MQISAAKDTATTEDDYLAVIRAKTAALFAAACQVGAVVAARPAEEERALAAFGMNVGIAFQLVDDALDYAADQETLGKTVGDDFREGKITMPVLAAFAAADEAGRTFWRRTLEAGEQDETDFGRATRMMEQSGAIRATLDRAVAFADDAKAALGVFPPSPIRDTLAQIADYTVWRAR